MRSVAMFCFPVAVVLALAGCSNEPVAKVPDAKQEISAHLSELTQEVRALRGEVAVIRDAVTDLHRKSLDSVAVPRPGRTGGAPTTLLASVPMDDDPQMGVAVATIGVVEFTDYQCPFCKRFYDQTFSRLKQIYVDTGKVRWVVRDFPLPFHAQAIPAAVAANCAGQQGAYWKMHDELFSQQRQLGADLFRETATSIGLEVGKFTRCLDDPEVKDEVMRDYADGGELGVGGTPAFFIGRIDGDRLINAVQVTGAQPFAAFSTAIDRLLANDTP